MTRTGSRTWYHLWLLSLFIYAGAAILLRGYSEDEGAYVYQSLLVAHGHLPYRDFFTTQGPGLLFFLAPASALLGGSLTLVRVFCGLVTVATAIAVQFIAERAGGAACGRLAAFLLLVTPAFWFESVIPRTQCLTVFLVALILLCLERGGEGRWAFPLLVVSMVGVVATRSSFLLVPAGIAFALWLNGEKKRGIAVAATTYGILIAGFLTFQWLTKGQVPYFLLTSHYEIMEAYYSNPSAAKISALEAGAKGQSLLLLLLVVCPFVVPRVKEWTPLKMGSLLTFLLPTVIHTAAPYFHPVYQVSVVPCLVIFLALHLNPKRPAACWGLVVLAVATLPFQFQTIYVDTDPRGLAASRHKSVADLISREVGPGATVLTIDPGIATGDDFQVPRGLEFGLFGIRFDSGKYSEEYSKERGLLNSEMFFRLLHSQEVDAVFIPANSSTAAWQVERTYELVEEWDRFGQGGMKWQLYLRKDRRT